MDFVSPILSHHSTTSSRPNSSSNASTNTPILLAVLYQDAKEQRFIRTYKVNPSDKDIIPVNAATTTPNQHTNSSSTRGGVLLTNSSIGGGGGSNAGAIRVSDSASILVPVHPTIGKFDYKSSA